MIVEYARCTDKDEIMSAWKYCFDDTPAYADYYFENRYNPKATLILRDHNTIVASLQKNSYAISISGTIYDTPYIVGVMTLPEHRGHGHMGTLLRQSLSLMREEGSCACILMPANNSIYRRFGFENISSIREYSLKPSSISGFKSSRRFVRIDSSNPNLANQMCSTYGICMKGMNLYTVRDDAYFENFIKEMEADAGFVYASVFEDSIDGYIAYSIANRRFWVREIAYENVDSLKSILGFMASHSTQVDGIVINTFEDDCICDLIPNIRSDVEISTRSFLMGRILDFERFTGRIIPSQNFSSLSIGIRDELLGCNNSGFRIVRNGKSLEVDKVNIESCDVEMDIAHLSQLAFSGISAKKLAFLGQIKYESYSHIEILDILFPKRPNFFNEYV